MPLTPPPHIVSAGIIGAPVTYQWDSDIGLEFYGGEDMNIRLYEAIDRANFKAKMAVAVAITEWIVWRFDGLTDIGDAVLRIEAAWASAIDPSYVNDLSFEMVADDDQEPIVAPLESALCLLGEVDALYANGDVDLAGRIVNPAMLARHLLPTKKSFNDWLTDALRRAAKLFPRGPEYDEDEEEFDYSHEKPVPREFFDPSFQYSEAAAQAALNAYLKSLDPKKNPYLRSAKAMKADGFGGTPYQI